MNLRPWRAGYGARTTQLESRRGPLLPIPLSHTLTHTLSLTHTHTHTLSLFLSLSGDRVRSTHHTIGEPKGTAAAARGGSQTPAAQTPRPDPGSGLRVKGLVFCP